MFQTTNKSIFNTSRNHFWSGCTSFLVFCWFKNAIHCCKFIPHFLPGCQLQIQQCGTPEINDLHTTCFNQSIPALISLESPCSHEET